MSFPQEHSDSDAQGTCLTPSQHVRSAAHVDPVAELPGNDHTPLPPRPSRLMHPIPSKPWAA